MKISFSSIKKLFMCFFLVFNVGFKMKSQTYFEQQLKFSKFKAANQNCEKEIIAMLDKLKIQKSKLQILIRAFKVEQKLEIWAKNESDTQYKLLKIYPVCAISGSLGPKIKQGDRQIPEGFYHIDRFNPSSAFHLSLGINYPNAADLKRNAVNPGGDIFIHGECVTIGCLPMTNKFIEEIYLLAVLAKSAGQKKIPVFILPSKNLPKTNEKHLDFWKKLFVLNAFFEKNGKLPNYSIDTFGNYILKD
jgi:murein L,D-transpeptidase YafK